MNLSGGTAFVGSPHTKERAMNMTAQLLSTTSVGGNIHVGLAAIGAAIGVGLIGTAVGRNPGAATKILVQSILSIAFAEAIVFYTLFLVK